MTEKLKTLLDERASALDFPVPDLAAVRGAGGRRRRRQYAGVVTGTLAAAACVAGVVLAALPGSGSSDAGPDLATDSPAPPSAAPARPFDRTLARGSVIMPGAGADIETGRPIAAFVATEVGYVITDREGGVWSVQDGEVTPLGQTDERSPDLLSDRTTSKVGWIDQSGAAPVYVVADQATGDVATVPVDTTGLSGDLRDGTEPAYFYALDSGTAYVRTTEGAVAVDLASGDQHVVDPGAGGFDVVGADAGVVAFARESDDGQGGILLGPTRAGADVVLEDTYAGSVAFSPDGRFVSVDGETLTVYDSTTGEQLDLGRQPGFSVGYGWLDDDTVLGIALRESDTWVRQLECSVTALTCEVTDPTFLTVEELESGRVILPTGQAIVD